MSAPDYRSYVSVLGEALREVTVEAIQGRNEALGSASEDFRSGYLCGFHRVITLMQQTAEVWNIPPDELGVADISESQLT
ncbi:MAG: hypothetical protein M3M95_02250 [Pseudomonadota bacterium]|nr:hypothetical protein [Pseudomonadota bacterium]